MLELVGMGLGMKLLLDVRDGNLHCESDGYFWQVLGVRIPLADGAQWLSSIHVEDLVCAVAHLCRMGGSGGYNFTAPERVTQARLPDGGFLFDHPQLEGALRGVL